MFDPSVPNTRRLNSFRAKPKSKKFDYNCRRSTLDLGKYQKGKSKQSLENESERRMNEDNEANDGDSSFQKKDENFSQLASVGLGGSVAQNNHSGKMKG